MRLKPDNDLTARAFARLDARLTPETERPLALALSGGGDSVALLRLATDWARGWGRRVLALTVDHRLNAESGGWTKFAGEAARAAGADWRGLSWDGDKPKTGLTAAARAARHELIADAAREAGARVVLFAHTADDIAEADLMRAQGSTLGRVREWSPSPAWPQGRGLMLLRPLLGERRGVLRDWLAGQGADWIEDPANADPRFGRSRARHILKERALAGAVPETPDVVRGGAGGRPTMDEQAMARVDRDIGARALAAALVCVGGGGTPPRGARLQALTARLKTGADFAATLCGARIEAAGDGVRVMREAGELGRRGAAPLVLAPGVEAVWDGRFAFRAERPGWSVVAARGRLSSLSDADRAEIGRLPAATRGAWPVLIRDAGLAPVLAGEGVERRALVAERLRLALDETTHEDDLISATR
ncbi:tRNA lysidine(34) synthetase TilS [Brevundimonas intermedia]|uniref:tRNA lysidine(34) synthetase TilS n=1 Tax=Brevundimonas intermedia TaxID=74315 RepID=UPI001ADDE479|nr:tRNA lysidine(34) synthetase TilS [Brevundimonas intermedia]